MRLIARDDDIESYDLKQNKMNRNQDMLLSLSQTILSTNKDHQFSETGHFCLLEATNPDIAFFIYYYLI